MIRKFQQSDIDQVISIWLEASIEVHDFVGREFWESKVDDMREIYIPSKETYIYEKCGFKIEEERIDKHTGHLELTMKFDSEPMGAG